MTKSKYLINGIELSVLSYQPPWLAFNALYKNLTNHLLSKSRSYTLFLKERQTFFPRSSKSPPMVFLQCPIVPGHQIDLHCISEAFHISLDCWSDGNLKGRFCQRKQPKYIIRPTLRPPFCVRSAWAGNIVKAAAPYKFSSLNLIKFLYFFLLIALHSICSPLNMRYVASVYSPTIGNWENMSYSWTQSNALF